MREKCFYFWQYKETRQKQELQETLKERKIAHPRVLSNKERVMSEFAAHAIASTWLQELKCKRRSALKL